MKNNKLLKFSLLASGLGASAFLSREIYCAVMYLYNISVKRGDKTFLTRLIDVSNEADVLCDDLEEEGKRIAKWARENKTEEVYINGYNNTKLYGEIYKNNTNKWVIILHGYGGECTLMDYAGEVFFNKGFNVIIPDLRGHGKSGGAYIGMGWHDRLDIVNWINEIIKRDMKSEIVLYGVSMGGAAVMMCSGEKLAHNVKCIIEDCGYTSVYEIFKCQMKKFKIPSFPLLNMTGLVCKFKNNYSIFKASALNQVEKSELPMLFLHGENDGFVPSEMTDKLYASKIFGYKEKYIFKGAGHGVSAMVGKEKYWNRVFDFIERFVN